MVDVVAVADLYFPGIVVQKNLHAAIAAWLLEHDGELGAADVPQVLALANVLLSEEVLPPYVPTTQPPYPATLPPLAAPLPRFPDANPAPDGWSVVTDEKVVRGGP